MLILAKNGLKKQPRTAVFDGRKKTEAEKRCLRPLPKIIWVLMYPSL